MVVWTKQHERKERKKVKKQTKCCYRKGNNEEKKEEKEIKIMKMAKAKYILKLSIYEKRLCVGQQLEFHFSMPFPVGSSWYRGTKPFLHHQFNKIIFYFLLLLIYIMRSGKF